MGQIRQSIFTLEAAWLEFLTKLFTSKGFVVSDETRPDQRRARPDRAQPDLVIKARREQVVVELKIHRSDRVSLVLVRNGFAQLKYLIDLIGAQRGILVIPQHLEESRYLPMRPDRVELWDLGRLFTETQDSAELAADLADLLRALKVGAERPPEGSEAINELGDTPATLPPLGRGAALAEQLEGIPPGNKDGAAQKFEELCEEALRLLFDKDLLGWRSQSDIGQGFQRVDVIARLQPSQSAFWSTLSADFRTRYVVFEFKNYADPITQDQVYTTEKYLFTSALRSVAIIIAKNGSAESADRAMSGALREQGKLILCLSMAEFCSLLRGFDVGDNPEEVLIRKVDDLLMAIAR